MLFKSLAADEIRKTVGKLREEFLLEQDENREKLKDFYENRQIKDAYLDYGFKQKDGKWIIPPQSYNITKKVIDKISMVYKYPPERMLEEAEDEYAEFLDDKEDFNPVLKIAERYKNLLEYNVLWRPHYDEVSQRWRYYIETEAEPHFIEGDPLHPFAYSIPIKPDTTIVGDVEEEQVYIFWSDELYFYHDAGGNIWTDQPDGTDWKGENKYGIMPLVELRKSIPVDQYQTSGAIDLVQGNQAINVAMMDLNVSIHHQSFDQPYATGVDSEEAKKLEIGANKLTTFDSDTASMGLLGYNPKLIEVVECVKFMVNLLRETYNLTATFSIETNPASGFSLMVQNIDMVEAREDDVEVAKMHEEDIQG